jgi:hypothetical protein
MSASDTAYTAQAAHGWANDTLLDAVLEYLDNQGSDDALADYLRDYEEGQRTYCTRCRAQTSEGPDGNDLCDTCIDGQHHEITLEPDDKYEHLARPSCSCGWSKSGWGRRDLAAMFGTQHIARV